MDRLFTAGEMVMHGEIVVCNLGVDTYSLITLLLLLIFKPIYYLMIKSIFKVSLLKQMIKYDSLDILYWKFFNI